MGFSGFISTETGANLDSPQSTLTSTDVSKEEDAYALKESPPGEASYSLQSYKELFPGYPLPAQQPGQPGFENDAPPELTRAMKINDGETSVLCGASMGDNRISCGVHLFDDPKSGAPYVVPLPDTGRSMRAVPEEVGDPEDMAQDAGGFGARMQQSSPGLWMCWLQGEVKSHPSTDARQRRCSFLEVPHLYKNSLMTAEIGRAHV